ncbi:hypothetical protein LCGC14_1222450 [marine sediment metagenome]|uniref:Uncharacterized protein n=1 Tax=marine sediment metagenome TaxID=412755 RepID=A0A0F9PFA6_9ZZZZ
MIRLWLRRLCGVLMIVVGGVVCCLLLGLVLPVLAVCGVAGCVALIGLCFVMDD